MDLSHFFRGKLFAITIVAVLTASQTTVYQAQAQEQTHKKNLLMIGQFGSWHAYNSAYLRDVPGIVAATGKLALVGTLTVPETTKQPPQYKAVPGDRLVWQQFGQKTVEFAFTAMKGDFANNGGAFLSRAHTLKYRVVVKDERDLVVDSTRVKTGPYTSRYETKLKGSILYEGKKYAVDLTLKGEGYFESSFGGFEFRDDHTLTGTIRGPDVQATVDEAKHFAGIGTDVVNVTFDWHKLNNKVVGGGKAYQWKNVFLKKQFRNGNVTGANTDWVCEGGVLVDGQPFATFGRTTQLRHLVYQIHSAAGTVEIGRWRLP